MKRQGKTVSRVMPVARIDLTVKILFIFLFSLAVPAIPQGLSHSAYAAAAPDLIVQNISSAPVYPAVGDGVTFSVTLKNQGDAGAGTSHVALYVDNVELTTVSLEPLGAGATSTKTFTWTAVLGSHQIKAVADVSNEIAEADEGNNTTTFSLSPLAPDLIVQDITMTPENPSQGDTVSFSVTVKNRGGSRSRASGVRFHIDDVLRGELDIPVLEAGASVTRTLSWTAKAGTHRAKAVADFQGQVAESDENNNEKLLTFSTEAPNLFIEAITWSPANPSKGANVTFTVIVKNQGVGKADSSFLAFYIDDVLIGTESVSPLDAGANESKTFPWYAITGSHIVRAVADSNAWLVETDETNNEKKVALITAAPDLIIKSVTWTPTSPSVGDTITFAVTIQNQGIGRADGFNFGYALIGSISGYQAVEALNAGASVTKTFTWMVEAGVREIALMADSAQVVEESDEKNNEKRVQFTPMGADLIVKDITWSPEDALAGDTVTFMIIVKNQSSGRAEGSYVAFYIDGSSYGTMFLPAVAGSATGNVTLNWTVAAGQHNLKAVADVNYQVTENDETNNEKTITFLPAAPDLEIQNVRYAPENPAAGSDVTLEFNIKNKGNGRAKDSYVAYYVDDTLRGYYNVPEIDAGTAVTQSFTWKAETGSHAIRFVADSKENLAETDEGNNVKIINLPTPDLMIQDITRTSESPPAGASVTATVTVKNQGAGKAAVSRLAVFLDGVNKDYLEISALDAGATVKRDITWIAAAGATEIRLVVDADDILVESDEGNNEESLLLKSSVPDLTVTSIEWSLNNPQNKDEVTFTVIIKNQGIVGAGGFYMTCSTDGTYLTSTPVDPIAAGATFTNTFTIITEPGAHDIKVVADSSEVITESDETNNEMTVSFSTVAPDIVIQKLTWLPQNPWVEDVITFSITVQNQGRGKSSATRFSYYIDDSLKGYRDIPAVNAGASLTEKITWLAEVGAHSIKVVVDANEAELDKANNTVSQKVTVRYMDAAGNPAGKSAGSGSFLGEMSMGLWWVMIGAGIILCAVLYVVWTKSR